ncbi:YegP family protein [Sphingobacterium thalpophilum]|uniref:YegP family protein n=1 Tax=Sphingobacterium thalpophilum TaxID=259 RepID=UPI003C70E4DC
MGKFVVTARKNGEYQFNLKAGNGQTILGSEGYSSKASCLNGIESVRKNAQDDGRFEKKTSSNGKWYFNLKASNGQIVGTSEMYECLVLKKLYSLRLSKAYVLFFLLCSCS